MSNKNRIESADSLWDVDFELADQVSISFISRKAFLTSFVS
jgi:hypothetical protein